MPNLTNLRPRTLLGASLLLAPAFAQAPCWESSLGTNLMLGDEAVAQNLPLGFAFPGPGGPVTAIDVSSNGFLWLASNPNSACCAGNATLFLSDLPRIAPLWIDLDPSAGGSVHFNTFPNRAVITWDRVPEFNATPPSGVVTMQVQLESNGTISMAWSADTMVHQNIALVGVTQGNGAVPNAVNMSAAPIVGTTNPTVYEEFLPGNFDLANRYLQFVPTGAGGYLIAERRQCQQATFATYGTGCPRGLAAFEQFAVNGLDLTNRALLFTPNNQGGYAVTNCSGFCYNAAISNNLFMYYDEVRRGLALPFSFPFPGGSTSAIDISSNGQIYLRSNAIATSRLGPPDVNAFANDAPSLAPLWIDMFPGLGNGVFFDVDPSGQAVYITFDQVPEVGHLGALNTFQCTLFQNGSFQFGYQSVGNSHWPALVGFSNGDGAGVLGSLDWTARVPFVTGASGAPLNLAAGSGARPRLGTTFPLQVRDLPVNSGFGALILGFTAYPTGIDLAALGMPGCRQYCGLGQLLPFAVAGPTASLPLAVPNSPALAGLLIHVQAAAAAGWINAAGLVSSNGATLGLGI